jgi:hypothetical protein
MNPRVISPVMAKAKAGDLCVSEIVQRSPKVAISQSTRGAYKAQLALCLLENTVGGAWWSCVVLYEVLKNLCALLTVKFLR